MSQENYLNQIKSLEKKLNLVKAYKTIINDSLILVQSLKLEDKELETEIVASLANFAQSKISEQFETATPKILIQPNSQPTEQSAASRSIQLPEPDFMKDPLKFVTKFKHWCNKVGKFKDGQGNEIQGIITGLTYPTLQVSVGDMDFSVSPAEIQLILEKK
jgi:hypothetical protein